MTKGQGEVTEHEVEEAVGRWLETKGFPPVKDTKGRDPIRQFRLPDGRLDFLAARWHDSQLHVIGVECKGKTNPNEVWGISSGQLSRYLSFVPKLYFACSRPREKLVGVYEELCRLAGVGLLLCSNTDNGPVVNGEVAPPYPLSAHFDNENYVQHVRSRVVMLFTFAAVCPEFQSGKDWISSVGEVQFNVAIRSDGIWFGVNIEKARDSLARVDRRQLVAELQRRTDQCYLAAYQERYFGEGRRSRLTVLRKPAKDVTETNLSWLRRLSETENIHLSINQPIWHVGDVLPSEEYRNLMTDARARLEPLFRLLGG